MGKGFTVMVVLAIGVKLFYDYFDEVFYFVGEKATLLLPEQLSPSSPPPDYSLEENWIALPHVEDFADVIPEGPGDHLYDGQGEAKVDVFYVHPTTYFHPFVWNGIIHETGRFNPLMIFVNFFSDWISSVTGQVHASAFNHVGRVFGPRYRQMSGIGFLSKSKVREQAMNLAYTDVKRSFKYYLEHFNNGRPIILSSHSQGSQHLETLINDPDFKDVIDKHLVVAYLLAGPLFQQSFSTIPVCEHESQTKCIVGYNLFVEGGDPSKFLLLPRNATHEDRKSLICVNPLSWRNDEIFVPAVENKGSRPIKYHLLPLGWIGGEMVPQAHSAQCKDGVLWSNRPVHFGFTHGVFPGSNYHGVESSFFFVNLRINALQRVKSFLKT